MEHILETRCDDGWVIADAGCSPCRVCRPGQYALAVHDPHRTWSRAKRLWFWLKAERDAGRSPSLTPAQVKILKAYDPTLQVTAAA